MTNKRITYISNFHPEDKGGGWDGINHFLHRALAKDCSLDYVQINPPRDPYSTLKSRCQKLMGLSREFPIFSANRLDKISRQVALKDGPVFFFGATPWIHSMLTEDYFVYLDICFEHYSELYFPNEAFRSNDIHRISQKEIMFLHNAKHIFWGSTWAKECTEKRYKTTFSASTILKTGGNIELLPTQIYSKNNNPALLFVSLDFSAKGGHAAMAVFKKLKSEQFENLEIWIVGQKPPQEYLGITGVKYFGRIDKNSPGGSEELARLYSSASMLIHLSKMDTMGAVLVEAGYYGLPAITINQFGMPEIIHNSPAKVIIEPNKLHDVDHIAWQIGDCLNSLVENPVLNTAIMKHFRETASWKMLAQTVIEQIN
jgi:glycosyltransferase involved in cell wall biosynthesis